MIPVALIVAAYFLAELMFPAHTDRGELLFNNKQYAEHPDSSSAAGQLPS